MQIRICDCPLKRGIRGHKKNDPEGKKRSDFYASFSEMHEQALSSYTAVILRVNPDEKDKELRKINDEFLRSLKEVRQHMMKGRLIEARTGCDQLRDNSISLLKKEWERVKRGEKAYRASKVVAAALFLVSFPLARLVYYPILNLRKKTCLQQ
ncbi:MULTISPECIES: hypothetical protein [Methylobacter]|uniref:hypothetical protein n=1 Tax=Methylobacter TaxID=429 RepID=UPI0003798C2F|nr:MULTISPECIES: hypothetical protein [Methylobacter]